MDAHGRPLQGSVTEGTAADSAQARPLREGREAAYRRADKAYDTHAILAAAPDRGMTPVIPPTRHRTHPRDEARVRYRLRHWVENGFGDFKPWRGGATR